MNQRFLDWVIGFVLGVLSSLIADVILSYTNARSIATKAVKLITKRQGMKLLKELHKISTPSSNNPHSIVRGDWAYALFDLGSSEQNNVLKALNSMFYLADLLDPDEKEVAHEALRLRFAINPYREIDPEYIRTMQKIRS